MACVFRGEARTSFYVDHIRGNRVGHSFLTPHAKRVPRRRRPRPLSTATSVQCFHPIYYLCSSASSPSHHSLVYENAL